MNFEPLADTVQRRRHWDTRYADTAETGVSWYQPEALVSLALIELLRIPSAAPVIDVGGGASVLIDQLVARQYSDLSVLDLSSTALDIARGRVGEDAGVSWLYDDVLTWRPARRYSLWHDRAVFHFLTGADDQAQYLRTMRSAVGDDGAVIVATFASDGPDHCSGLPVTRYSAAELGQLLDGFTVVETLREEHITPGGSVQPFTWIAATRAVEQQGAWLR